MRIIALFINGNMFKEVLKFIAFRKLMLAISLVTS